MSGAKIVQAVKRKTLFSCRSSLRILGVIMGDPELSGITSSLEEDGEVATPADLGEVD